MDKPIYIFSGLGVDERVFQNMDFSNLSVTFIQWITPQANETIEQYANRIATQITTPKPILIGLSFGGMMAIEVAKQIETEQVILIASAKTRQEIPFYFRWIGRMRLHRIVPTMLFKQANWFTYWLFGTTAVAEKKLLKTILADMDSTFLRWAIDVLLRWQNQVMFTNIRHLHGTADRILPIRFVQCDGRIHGGGHLMTLNKADAVTSWIIAQSTDEQVSYPR